MTVLKVAKTGEQEAEFRQFLSYLFAQGSAGIAADGVLAGLAVTQTSTASASVEVSVGAAVIQDTRTAGAFPMVSNAVETLDVLTANPLGGLPRNDLVVLDYATSSVRVIVGTPNASPTDPSVPATAVALARLRHFSSATTVPANRIDDLRVATDVFSRDIWIGGYVDVNLTGGTSAFVDITFPAGTFPAAPAPNPVAQTSAAGDNVAQFSNVTASGMRITARRRDGSAFTGTITVSWEAKTKRPL